jgi:hypothetical protein
MNGRDSNPTGLNTNEHDLAWRGQHRRGNKKKEQVVVAHFPSIRTIPFGILPYKNSLLSSR